MRETQDKDARLPGEPAGIAEAALESKRERDIKDARDRTNALADRYARTNSAKLGPGKVVRLKSGSPPMTVARVDIISGLVDCHYFWRGGPGQGRYGAEMLEPCEPAPREDFVPGIKPGCGAERLARARPSRGNPGNRGGGDEPAPLDTSQEPKINRRAAPRFPHELAPGDPPIPEHRERGYAWRAAMRRVARLRRREREKLMPQGTEADIPTASATRRSTASPESAALPGPGMPSAPDPAGGADGSPGGSGES